MASNTNYFAMIDDDNDFEMWQGLRGPAGPAGPAGKSAYEAAQEGGYTGSEAQFNAALAEVDTALQPSDVDTELSPVSTNPVQNRAVYEALAQAAIKKTVTGNPVTFYGLEAAENLYGLKVNIKAVQAAGTPSPDNKIPISGWNNVRIWNKATYDPTLSPTATIALSQVVGQAVYGGTLNVKTGKLVIDYDCEDGFDYSAARGFSTRNGYTTAFISYQGVIVDPDAVESTICDSFVWDSTEKATGFSIYVGSNSTSFYFTLPGELTAEQWRARMTEIHPMIVGKIATPVEVDLTPLEVAVLVGQTNNVWSDAGTVTVTFAANEIEIDGELSDTSENPVQNKVITEALENVSIPVDNQLNLFSANPVENRVISNELALQSAELVRQKSAIDTKAGALVDESSGAIASFVPDATIDHLLGLDVNIEPVQDLHGFDAPWPGGAKVSKCPTFANGTHNLANGVTITIQDGKITINGTPTAAGYWEESIQPTVIPDDAYISFNNPVASQYVAIVFMSGGRNKAAPVPTLANRTTSVSAASGQTIDALRISFNSQGSFSNFEMSPIVHLGSTPQPYSQYSNICPISGWSEVGISSTSINIWDEVWEIGSIDNSTGQNTSTGTNRFRSKNYIPIRPNTEYCIYNGSGVGTYAYFYDKGKAFIGMGSIRNLVDNCKVDTSPANAYYMRFRTDNNASATYNHDISINYPATDKQYHAYSGNTYTIQLGQTVYGGTLDAVNGTMTITHAGAEFDGSSDESWAFVQQFTPTQSRAYVAVPGIDASTADSGIADLISNKYQASAYAMQSVVPRITGRYNIAQINVFVPPTTREEFISSLVSEPLQVVYKLATPITISLDPVTIATIANQTNNVWANAGNVSVTFAADIKAYIDRLNQPTEDDMIANSLIANGKYFTINNRLFLSTASIAAGAQIIPGTNCTETSLAAALNALNA